MPKLAIETWNLWSYRKPHECLNLHCHEISLKNWQNSKFEEIDKVWFAGRCALREPFHGVRRDLERSRRIHQKSVPGRASEFHSLAARLGNHERDVRASQEVSRYILWKQRIENTDWFNDSMKTAGRPGKFSFFLALESFKWQANLRISLVSGKVSTD